jgi:energy-coupling factor transport system permease protein
MLQNISPGVYYPGNSVLHRLQGRTKLVLLLWCAIWLYLANWRIWHFAPLIVGAVLLATMLIVSGISPRVLWQRMGLLIILTLIGSILLPFSTEVAANDISLATLGPFLFSSVVLRDTLLVLAVGGFLLLLSPLLPFAGWRALWQRRGMRFVRVLLLLALCGALLGLWQFGGGVILGPFFLTRAGVWSLVFVAGLLLLYAFSLLVMLTTSPVALVESITSLLAPLRLIRFPVDDFALMLLIALRFIPTLLEEIEQLMKAQMARGATFSEGTLVERFQGFGMLVVPLLRSIFQRASDLSTALDARGYVVNGKQTMLHEARLSGTDYLAIGVVLFVTTGSLFLL